MKVSRSLVGFFLRFVLLLDSRVLGKARRLDWSAIHVIISLSLFPKTFNLFKPLNFASNENFFFQRFKTMVIKYQDFCLP